VTEPVRSAGVEDTSLPLDAFRYAELPEERRRMLLHVSDLLDTIAYGSVVLVLHEGRVVQVEMSEKIRL
jgi:hypothetical protein